ncbi:MAG: universal stress protein [Bacillota bacterium]
MSKKVILATDFSDTAEKLLNCLDELKPLGYEEIILTHVINIHSAKIVNVDQFKRSNQEVLEGIKKNIAERGFEVQIEIPVGDPADELKKLAKKVEADLILIASHGRGFIKRVFLGSTTYDLIRQTETPVLIEKYKNLEKGGGELACARKFNRILLPIDFSTCSQGVVEYIKDNSKLLEEVILLAVIESSNNIEELEEQKETAREKLAGTMEELQECGLNCEISYKVDEGAASDNIIRVAEEEEVGLVIMAKRGEGRIKEMMLGSTADRVAKKSPVPVLLVPCEYINN